ncbi:Uncharacterised protein [Bordetella pertussis]|nr:Uncharacterised protein [Bordetella pertussis]CFP61715.1 Uncharacterised protein [Bordetella pertussis]CFW41201.1 Uncharacterised protein [Bordetella pertussis]
MAPTISASLTSRRYTAPALAVGRSFWLCAPSCSRPVLRPAR